MKILLVGHGGREHALLDKLRTDAPDARFYITRGNGGTSRHARAIPLSPSDAPALAFWAESEAIDLTVVGPEGPLAAGIADQFIQRGLPIFGPTRKATAIESSKSYAKALLRDAGVPTAEHATFTDIAEAESYIRERGAPIVVKASGLAGGKGAIVCETEAEALDAARAMLEERAFGEAGGEIVIEEFLTGEELSVFALTDGTHALAMIPAQDHKRIGEGDTGPNTGGMGAYAPVSLTTDALMERVNEDVLLPTLEALRDDERPFRGLLYAGLMITSDGPRVIEFNARFGDPETQALLPLMRSNLLEPMLAIGRGESIESMRLDWADAAACTTVLAAGGYPGAPKTGVEIHMPDNLESEGIRVYHAGTRIDDGRLVTDGGRVLAVTAVAPTLERAAALSRDAAGRIDFEGRQYRSDIGWREIARNAGAA